jgi:tetratricopeptide (TPR) repeat protein
MIRDNDATDATLPAQDTPVRADSSAPSGDDHTVMASDGASSSAPVSIRAGGAADFREMRPIDPKNFAVGNELARGGMGRIVAARDLRLGRQVVIKELLSNTAAHRARFEREARITARLQHPAIVNIHEAGTWPGGEPFYVMRLIAGRSLDKVIASRTTLEERLALLPNAIAAVDALAYAHSENVIHRDLKPANVLVGDFGETVVIDWGLAKDLSANDDNDVEIGPYRTAGTDDVTVVGTVMGTPAYMPVEQATGNPVDARADVYALGAMLFHMLAGKPPFVGKSSDEILDAVVEGPPISIAARLPGVPPDLVTIVEKAMARSADDRYPTARELSNDLKKFQTGQLVGAHRYSTWQLMQRWAKRHRIAIAVAGAAMVVLVVVAVVSVRRILAERRATDRQSELARQARGDAEDLMSFMLTDLRDKLQPLGKVKLLDEVATKAVAYYAKRSDTLSDADEMKRAEARRNLGDVLRAQGDAARALTEYRASQATAEALATKDPSDNERQHALALSLYRVGLVLASQGDGDAALVAFRRQQELAKALVAKAPANTTWIRSVALGQANIARILTSRGETANALAVLRESLALREKLVGIDATNTEWQRDLVAAHVSIGERLQLQGDLVGALAAFQKSLTIAVPLAAKDPQNAAWQGDLAVSHQKIGEALVSQGDTNAALEAFRACLAIYLALAAKDPDDAFAQSDVSGVQAQIGEVLLSTGDAARATEAFRAVLAISEALAAKDPSNADRQWIVAFSHEKVGDGLRALGDGKGALASYKASLALAEVVAKNDPSHADKQRSVSAAREKIGDLLLEGGDTAAALAQYEAVFAIAESLATSDPSHAQKQRALAIAHIKLGDILLAQARPADATARFRLAASLLEKLATSDSTSASRAGDLALGQAKLGNSLLAQGDAPGALVVFRAYLEAATKLAAKDSNNLDWQSFVVDAHERVGDALLATRDATGARAEYTSALALARQLLGRDPTFAKRITSLQAKASR